MFLGLTTRFFSWSKTNILEISFFSPCHLKLSFMLLPHLTSSSEHSGQSPVTARELQMSMWMEARSVAGAAFPEHQWTELVFVAFINVEKRKTLQSFKKLNISPLLAFVILINSLKCYIGRTECL